MWEPPNWYTWLMLYKPLWFSLEEPRPMVDVSHSLQLSSPEPILPLGHVFFSVMPRGTHIYAPLYPLSRLQCLSSSHLQFCFLVLAGPGILSVKVMNLVLAWTEMSKRNSSVRQGWQHGAVPLSPPCVASLPFFFFLICFQIMRGVVLFSPKPQGQSITTKTSKTVLPTNALSG